MFSTAVESSVGPVARRRARNVRKIVENSPDATLRDPLQHRVTRCNNASMWFSKRNEAPGLTQELVERTWELTGRLKLLESTLDERLVELSNRYRRAEQSEKRLDDKKASTPCDDKENGRKVHPALKARYARRDALNAKIKEQV